MLATQHMLHAVGGCCRMRLEGYNSPMTEANRISGIIVDCALTVHKKLGPGLLESVYKACLVDEMISRGLDVRTEVPMPVVYNDRKLPAGYRIDVLVNNLVIIEIKAIDGIAPIHEAQVLTYLKLSGHRLALLINFNVPLIREGIRRFIM